MRRPKTTPRFWLISLLVLFLLLIAGLWGLRAWYISNLKPVSVSHQTVYFNVAKGDSKHKIGESLKRAGLIRSIQVFETYVRSNEVQILQAGTYAFNPSMNTQQIVDALARGQVAKNLLTILPGKRLDQIKEAFKAAGYQSSDIDAAFNPGLYSGHPALASLPNGASLEGYLYPDSFQKEADTPASVIIRESLDEMQKHLTADVLSGFKDQGLSVFQAITLASIVVAETDNPDSQPTVAQVFFSRLKAGMPLQADPTAFYASALAGQPKSLGIDSPYNTHLNKGLPPGPIGNVTKEALRAVAHPATSTYLYFVAGDDGKVHFTYTQAEHEAAVKAYCTRSCAH